MKIFKSIYAILLVITSINTFAEDEKNFYAGLGYGYVNNRDICSSSMYCKANETAWVGDIFVGYQPIHYLAFEFAYLDLGHYSGVATKQSLAGGIAIDLDNKVQALELSAVALLPITDAIDVYARFGKARVSFDMGPSRAWFISGGPTFHVREQLEYNTTTVWGVGTQYQVTDCIDGRIEYREYSEVGTKNTLSEYKIDLYALAATYHF